MRRISISWGLRAVATLGVLGVLVWPAASEACSCVGPYPACQATWQSAAVFVATVIRIDEAKPSAARPFDMRRVRVRITEGLRGDVGDEADVFTGRGGGDCGFDFAEGQQYLIYAYRAPDSAALSTGICSRTRRLAEATEDLAYLRGPARTPSTLGTIRGTAEQVDRQRNGEEIRSTLAGVRIIATGGGQSYETTTDGGGKYELSVPVGRYQMRAEVPSGQHASPGFPQVDVLDARGCAQSDIYVRWDGRISGRLLNWRGEPVPFLPVELITPERLDASYASPVHVVRTDDQGRFEFERIESGAFVLGVNTRRQPREVVIEPRVLLETRDGSARTIAVAPGERLAVGDFILPRKLEVVSLAGVVLSADGSPQAGARVYVKLDSPSFNLLGPAVTTDRDGGFVLSVVSGYRYKLNAEGQHEGRFVSSGDSAPIDTASVGGRIRLQLKAPPK